MSSVRHPWSGGVQRPVAVLLAALFLIASLGPLGEHDHGAAPSNANCVADHEAGPEPGHSSAPHLRSALEHEHDCEVCQQQRLRVGVHAARADLAPAERPRLVQEGSSPHASGAAAWSRNARGPPVLIEA